MGKQKNKKTLVKTDNQNQIENHIRVFTPCEYIVLDKQNRFSLINTYDRFYFSTLPVDYPVKIFLSLSISPGKHNIRVVAEDASIGPTELLNITQEIGSDRLFSLVIEGSFTFDYYGNHKFNVYIDNNVLGSMFILVAKPLENKGV